MRNAPVLAINGVTNSGTTPINSDPIPMSQAWGASATAALTSTLAGTLKMQVSCDPPKTPAASIVWQDLPNATSGAISAGGNGLIPKNDMSYQWLRLVFTPSAGNGKVTCNANVSGI